MVYILMGSAAVLWLGLAILSIHALFELGYFAKFLAVLFLIATFSALFYGISKENSKGPCVQYETQMHFNAATKTVMPARVCVLRGEWVE